MTKKLEQIKCRKKVEKFWKLAKIKKNNGGFLCLWIISRKYSRFVVYFFT